MVGKRESALNIMVNVNRRDDLTEVTVCQALQASIQIAGLRVDVTQST